MSTAKLTLPEGVRKWHWTSEEFHRAFSMGLFRLDEKLELIDGEIIEKMGGDPSHSVGVGLVQDALAKAFALTDCHLRIQHPIALPGGVSEPEPDVAVVRGQRRQYDKHHPQPVDTLLVVEVANTTLTYDRERKAPAYAVAGVVEYWILNLTDRQLEVHRHPQNGAYQSTVILTASQSASPMAMPTEIIRVADLLP